MGLVGYACLLQLRSALWYDWRDRGGGEPAFQRTGCDSGYQAGKLAMHLMDLSQRCPWLFIKQGTTQVDFDRPARLSFRPAKPIL